MPATSLSARRSARLRSRAVMVPVALWAAVALAITAGCDAGSANGAGPASSTTPAEIPTTVARTARTTAPPPPPSTTAQPCDRRPTLDVGPQAVPAELTARIDAALAHPGFRDVERSISVWVEGYGEVAAVEPDRALNPASNQKLFTAAGAATLLDPASTFRTEVRTFGDELVLVADGDPTLRSSGPHSLAELAAQVRRAGVQRVARVTVDASRFEAATTAAGWQDWQIPQYVGPLSALTVDDNRARRDDGYLADPALGNTETFVTALRRAGVVVDDATVTHGTAGLADPVVASVESAPLGDLMRAMLTRSDNEIAEALMREMGNGSTAAGAAAVAAALEPWCVHLVGENADGSGLSRADRRSAREWRRLLQVLAEQPWAGDVVSGLPVAGQSGTLAGRLRGFTTVGNVKAKTGTIIGGAALSGYATTTDGRAVVFSIVTNGDPAAAQRSIAAIDALVIAAVGP